MWSVSKSERFSSTPDQSWQTLFSKIVDDRFLYVFHQLRLEKAQESNHARSIPRIGRLITARAHSSLLNSSALGLSVFTGPLETHATEQIRQALSVTPAPAPELTRLMIR